MSEQLPPVIDELHDKLMVAFEREEQLTAESPTLDSDRTHEIDRADHGARTSRSMVRRCRSLPTGVVFAAVAVTASILAVMSAIVVSGRNAGPLTTQEALAQVARSAVERPLPFARDDQFMHTRSENSWMTMFLGGNSQDGVEHRSWAAMQDIERSAWVSVERKGVLVERRSDLHFVTARDRRINEAMNGEAGSSGSRSSGQHVMGLAPNRGYFMDGEAGRLTRNELLAYPTDPQTIYDRALKGLHGAGQGEADGVWQSLTGSLFENSLPPDLRAGMVRALGLIPGVESLGERSDPLGRTGLAFGRMHNGTRDEVIFDPASSLLLYMQTVLVERGAQGLTDWPAGTVIGRTLNREQNVVDEPPSEYANRLR